MHEQFLAAGIAVAGIDVGEAYGSPQGTAGLNDLYDELTGPAAFRPSPLSAGTQPRRSVGQSLGIEHPDRVAGLVGIYPVFDLRSYPGLDQAAPAYGIAPQELEQRLAELNPIAGIGRLAQGADSGVPDPRR